MRCVQLALFALFSVVLSTGCPGARWQGKANVPETIELAEETYVRFEAVVYSGGSPAPKEVESLEAACMRPQICTAELGKEGRVRVYGETAGTTTLEVAYNHPTHRDRRRGSVAVTVTGAPSRGTLELGTPIPEVRFVMIPDERLGALSCEFASERLWQDCWKQRESRGKQYLYARTTSPSSTVGGAIRTCVAVEQGAVVGWALTDDPRQQRYTVVGRIAGTPCARDETGHDIASGFAK